VAWLEQLQTIHEVNLQRVGNCSPGAEGEGGAQGHLVSGRFLLDARLDGYLNTPWKTVMARTRQRTHLR